MNTPKHLLSIYLLVVGILVVVIGGFFLLDFFLSSEPGGTATAGIPMAGIGVLLIVCAIVTWRLPDADDTATGKSRRNRRVAIVAAVVVALAVISFFTGPSVFGASSFLQYVRFFLVSAAIGTVVCAYAGTKLGWVVAMVGFVIVAIAVTLGYGDLSNPEWETIINGHIVTDTEERASNFLAISLGVTVLQFVGFLLLSSSIVKLCAPKARK